MGLTFSSTGKNAVDNPLNIVKKQNERIIALAGNPNVGKSTIFNNLTGMNQHTGNWPGKTVTNAVGRVKDYIFVDIPGTYSLMAHSAEEEVARNFICFGMPDAVVVVCDATCLERNLNLVLQTLEITKNVVVCVNLIDEAKRKNISIDLNKLSSLLGVKVIGTVARKKSSKEKLLSVLDEASEGSPLEITYPAQIETAISLLTEVLRRKTDGRINPRWLSLRLLDADETLLSEITDFLGKDLLADADVQIALEKAKECLPENFSDILTETLINKAEQIAGECTVFKKDGYNTFDMKIDRIVTSKVLGFPLMLLLLLFVFWITIIGANYPSELLSTLFLKLQDFVSTALLKINTPTIIHDMLVLGVLRVLCWVVAVMLPPMAIFFPLFTLLEDLGYLPRVAYNLDRPFKKCNACGKQALTMCMGFGCNAAGVTGCRIIDSKRERLIAIITNSFVPCNGRFPTLIAIISMFVVTSGGALGSFLSALTLTAVILSGILMTFLMSKLLSKTFLKGEPSSFVLELPPYRRPELCKTLVRSLFDRTLFVVGRAVAVAAPAGLVIWLMANVSIGGNTLLFSCSQLLDPLGRALGMDGVILLAFILGFPANEIVLPIILMTYLSQGTLTDVNNIGIIKEILTQNGWTLTTALCTMTFSLFHFPCSTTVVTVYKETGSLKWTLLSLITPTVIGMLCCFSLNLML
ncbi:MAG: ferrous iron transport protein B [Clostridia bacterium]|nr:ferrous iron transport protein B [Clostridia bacterium]